MKKNKLLKDQQALETGAGIKAVHDNIYRSKYVPQESAELLAQSPNAKHLTSTTSTPSKLGERESSKLEDSAVHIT